GLYQFVNLNPGRYQIKAERVGFAAALAPEIIVGAREMRRADLTLRVSGRIESVEVAATLPLMNTQNGTISDSISFNEIVSLPINFRSPDPTLYTAISNIPGVQGDSQLAFSIGGGLPAQASYTIDGVSNVDLRRFGPIPYSTPSPEIIGEI